MPATAELKNVVVKGCGVVKTELTYETNLDVQIGDRVLIPTPYWMIGIDRQGSTMEGIVTSLDSNYDGPCVSVIRAI